MNIPKMPAQIKPDCGSVDKDWFLANQHWDWLESLLRKIYIDSFRHGYKHGKEDKGEYAMSQKEFLAHTKRIRKEK